MLIWDLCLTAFGYQLKSYNILSHFCGPMDTHSLTRKHAHTHIILVAWCCLQHRTRIRFPAHQTVNLGATEWAPEPSTPPPKEVSIWFCSKYVPLPYLTGNGLAPVPGGWGAQGTCRASQGNFSKHVGPLRWKGWDSLRFFTGLQLPPPSPSLPNLDPHQFSTK